MSHFLFIRNEPSIPNTLREVFLATGNRIVIRQSATQAESALNRGVFDAVILYSEEAAGETSRSIREIRDLSSDVFILVLAPAYDLSTEQASFEAGADLYFSEPIPNQTLARILASQSGQTGDEAPLPDQAQAHSAEPPRAVNHMASTLHVLRDLSQILSFSLDYKAFTQHFILKLRDHISFSRIGIFLEGSAKQTLVKKNRPKHLTCVASIGLPSDLVDCFQLSREIGIGRELSAHPRIVHKGGNSQARFEHTSSSIDKEFSILGCHLAIPITDRENAVGLAVLSGPVTGRNYSEDELELLYLLMEELGLAIRNSRLHSELAQHGQLIENVMHSMASGAIVFSENLDILYINDAAKRFLGLGQQHPDRTVEFAELTSKLAVPVHRAVEKGELPEPFQIAGASENAIYQVSIFPFTQEGELILLPRPTMVILEDYTKIEANKETALQDSKSELISLIAERFAHEIRNSLVPLSTHAQLIDKKIDQPKFQASLKSAMLREIARIKRFSEQMLYLAQASQTGGTELDLDDVLEKAFERARNQAGNINAELVLNNRVSKAFLMGNPEAMTNAFEELFLNSMQAQPSEQTIQIQIQLNQEGILCLQWKDGGGGFSDEAIGSAKEPFFTTRHTGVGLGLSVAEKIISEHYGFLRLNRRSEEHDWDLEIELPSLINHT